VRHRLNRLICGETESYLASLTGTRNFMRQVFAGE
jgi:hypothetical protein